MLTSILKKIITKLILVILVSFLVIYTSLSQSIAKSTPNDFSELVEVLLPAVVSISSSSKANYKGKSPISQHAGSSLGSGFLVDKKGIIITNYHVIENTNKIIVGMVNNKKFDASIIGIDEELDIAVLKISSNQPFPFVTFGNSDKAKVGNWVVAIGNPFSLSGTVSAGIISARKRDILLGHFDNFIQTDAAINRGNSGGPLFNMNGKVVGVNSAIYSSTGGSNGIGFAVPANMVLRSVKQLMQFGEVRRGYMGIQVQDLTRNVVSRLGLSNTNGAYIKSITPGGPAHKAGLRPQDIIISLRGRPILNAREIILSVISMPIGTNAPISVIRNRKVINFTIKVVKRGGGSSKILASTVSQPLNYEGVTYYPINNETRRLWGIVANQKNGVLVGNIDKNSSARGVLQPGDIILEAAWKPVNSPGAFVSQLEGLRRISKAPVQIYVQRGNKQFSQKINFK